MRPTLCTRLFGVHTYCCGIWKNWPTAQILSFSPQNPAIAGAATAGDTNASVHAMLPVDHASSDMDRIPRTSS